MTGHGNYYDVDGRRSLDQRWPDADAVAAVGGPVREVRTDGGTDAEAIEQRLARLERIVFDEDDDQDDQLVTDGGRDLIDSEALGPAAGETYNPETDLPDWMAGTATLADDRGLYILTLSGQCSCGKTDYRLAPDWKVPAENGGGYMTDTCDGCLGTMEYSESWKRVDHVVTDYSELQPDAAGGAV